MRRDPLGPPLLFLVPQQATFLHEKRLAAISPGGGFSRAAVSSFPRLIQTAYQAAGQESLPTLSESGKLLLMRRVTRRREGGAGSFCPCRE